MGVAVPGVVRLDLSEVVRPTHRDEPLNADPNQQVDADTQRDPETEHSRGRTVDTLFPASSPAWAILGGLSHMKNIPCRSSILVKFWSGELPTLADLKLKFVVEVLKNTLFTI